MPDGSPTRPGAGPCHLPTGPGPGSWQPRSRDYGRYRSRPDAHSQRQPGSEARASIPEHASRSPAPAPSAPPSRACSLRHRPANGTAINDAAPQARVKPLRPPTPRQQTLWKAIRQAQLQGLSMRATARVLGISRNTVSAYLRGGGPPGRRGAASSTEQRPAREDMFAELLSGQSR